MEKIYKAALIVIGNEVLSGRTVDKNVNHIALKLGEKGVRLSEVRIIPDVEDEIIEAVQMLSKKFDYVFTTGGIGPTHDDITAACVAKAFGMQVVLNDEAVALLEDYYPDGELTDARLRMAMIPTSADLVLNPVSAAPGFKLKNVYVMAGVPRIMQSMLDNIVPTLTGGLLVLSKTIQASVGESAIAVPLETLENKHKALEIGSYPAFKQGVSSVSLVFRSVDEATIDQALQEALEFLEQMQVEARIV